MIKWGTGPHAVELLDTREDFLHPGIVCEVWYDLRNHAAPEFMTDVVVQAGTYPSAANKDSRNWAAPSSNDRDGPTLSNL